MAAAALSVAIFIVGVLRGTNHTASELHRAMLAPLLADGMRVDVYLGGLKEDKDGWLAWSRGFSSVAAVTFLELPTDEEVLQQRPASASFFAGCSQDGYHARWFRYELAWTMLKAKSVERSVSYDLVVRTRDDVYYHPLQFVKPCWLRALHADSRKTVLVNDKEVHMCGSRWNEDLGIGTGVVTIPADMPGYKGNLPPEHLEFAAVSRTPMTTTDQFFIATFRTMDIVLTMDSAPALPNGHCTNDWWTWTGAQMPGNPEHVVANYWYRNQIAWYPVSLQLGRAPKLARLQNQGYSWACVACGFVVSACRLCFDCAMASPFSDPSIAPAPFQRPFLTEGCMSVRD